MTKGYNFPPNPYEPVVEEALVGCRHCKHTWYEEHTFTNSCRINGPMYLYDACSECLPSDKPRPGAIP